MTDAANGSPFDAQSGGERHAVEQRRAGRSVNIGGAHGAQDNFEPPRASFHDVRGRAQTNDGEHHRAPHEAERQAAQESLRTADVEMPVTTSGQRATLGLSSS